VSWVLKWYVRFERLSAKPLRLSESNGPDLCVPDIVGGARVIYHTRIDSRHEPTGACRHVVADQEIGTVWSLAICQYDGEPSFYLFRCEADYIPITDTWHQTLQEAFDQAEFEYRGSSRTCSWN
jgi:hypothetical protein